MKLFIPNLVAFHIFLFFLGIGYGWSVFQYDELRLIQLSICIISIVYLVLSKKACLSIATCTVAITIFLLLIVNYENLNQYNKQDLLLLISFFLTLFSLKFSFEQRSEEPKLLYFIILAALIPCTFIFLSIFNYIDKGLWFDWQLNSGSIRIFDSAIIPIFYLTLYVFSEKQKLKDNIFLLCIFLIALSIFFDGARSALLSCIVPLILIFILSKENRSLIFRASVGFIAAFLVYYLTIYLFSTLNDKQVELSIARGSSSSRLDIWTFAFSEWLKSPIWGLGGGFLGGLDSINVNHLHNFYFKLVFEWGGAGLLLLICIVRKNYQYLTDDNNTILKAGILGIAMDAFFSGNLTYSGSLLTCILFLGFAYSKEKNSIKLNTIYLSKLVFVTFGVFFLYILVFDFYDDFICWGCGSYMGREAPGFWYYGAAKNLIPADQIP